MSLSRWGHHSIEGIIGQVDEVGKKIMGYAVCGSDADLEKFVSNGNSAFVTVGHIKSADLRKKLFNQLLDLRVEIPVVVSPQAYLSAHSDVRAGTILMHGSVVNSCAEIGNNCIINSMALVEHDVKVGDHIILQHAPHSTGGRGWNRLFYWEWQYCERRSIHWRLCCHWRRQSRSKRCTSQKFSHGYFNG